MISIILIGCGGSGGSSDNPDESNNNQSISGTVSDPAIEGALVKICKKDDLDDCLQYNTDTTDKNGKFTISGIDTDINLSEYVILANGGRDVQTGESFDDINLTTPADLVDADGKVMVSPITTLLNANNWNTTQLAQKLGIAESDIQKDPTSSKELQRKSLLLIEIAKKREDGFKSFEISDGNFSSFVENNFQDEITKKELKTIIEYLDENSSTASDIVDKINAIKTIFKSDTYKYANKRDENVFSNVKKWARAILKVANDANITSPNFAQIEAIFAITPDLNLSDANLTIDINASLIEGLSDIVPVGAVINHEKELIAPLGVDSDITGKKVRDYYFNSTISHLYQTEKLIKNMNDVSITDGIYVDIARGYINNNEIERGIKYAKNKIFLKDNKADVYRFAGEKLIDNNNTKAEELFDKAFDLYKIAIEARGEGEISENDIRDLAELFEDYNLIGNTTKSGAITAYIDKKKDEFSTAADYALFANAYRRLADELIEKGENGKAIRILNQGYTFLQDMPRYYKKSDPDNPAKANYMLKVLYYIQMAERLSKLNEHKKAVEIIDAAQAMRLNDGTTANGVYSPVYSESNKYDTSVKTYVYVKYMAAIYAAAGENAKALALIPTIIAKNASSLKREKVATYKQYAKGLALAGDMIGAFNIVDNNISKYYDKIEALTYLGVNKRTGFIALALIENGENAKAKEAIDKAVGILNTAVLNGAESSDSNKDKYYVRYGYSKLANLYATIGEDDLANTYFDKAIAIASGTESNTSIAISDPKEALDSLAQIIDDLDEVGLTSKAVEVMTTAIEIVDNNITSTKDKLSEYNALLKGDGVYAKREDIIDKMKKLIDVAIANDSYDIGESSHDKNHKKIVDYLVTMAEKLNEMRKNAKADLMLKTALTSANAIYSISSKIDKLQDIAVMYAKIGMIDKASNIVATIPFKGDRRSTIEKIARAVYRIDAFPNSDIASIDTDQDGKPDFFNIGTSQEEIDASGLELDDDNDGDGKLNKDDKTPFFPDN